MVYREVHRMELRELLRRWQAGQGIRKRTQAISEDRPMPMADDDDREVDGSIRFAPRHASILAAPVLKRSIMLSMRHRQHLTPACCTRRERSS